MVCRIKNLWYKTGDSTHATRAIGTTTRLAAGGVCAPPHREVRARAEGPGGEGTSRKAASRGNVSYSFI